ncbi:MAG TPA: VOC family protein [Terriglobales bacterium]|nr:VOC family protein [Terriglobales bacterium]
MIRPLFVDHLVWRVRDLSETEKFYAASLGTPLERAADSIMYQVGDTRLFFTRCTGNDAAACDKEQVGLNHFALGVRTLRDLENIQGQLDAAGIVHSGIQLDPYGTKEFIWTDDPDGLRVEFYLRPSQAD